MNTLSLQMMKTIDTLLPFHQQENLQFIDSTIEKEKLGGKGPTPFQSFLDNPKHFISIFCTHVTRAPSQRYVHKPQTSTADGPTTELLPQHTMRGAITHLQELELHIHLPKSPLLSQDKQRQKRTRGGLPSCEAEHVNDLVGSWTRRGSLGACKAHLEHFRRCVKARPGTTLTPRTLNKDGLCPPI